MQFRSKLHLESLNDRIAPSVSITPAPQTDHYDSGDATNDQANSGMLVGKNLVKLDASDIKKFNAEAFKAAYTSQKEASQFDIYRDKDTGKLVLQKISDPKVQVETDSTLDEAISGYPPKKKSAELFEAVVEGEPS